MVKLLTGEQREAVDWAGNLLLTACPGSGKTRTLIAKLVAEIEDVRGTPKSICCITYTNTAVQEIEQRATEQLQAGDDRHIHVSTIHSFCLHSILRPFAWLRPELGGARKVITRDNPDFEPICRHAAAQVNLLNLQQSDLEAFEGLGVDANGNVIGLASNNEAVCRAAPHFWNRCAQLGYIDFGQIVYGSYLLLREYPQIARSLCARHPWILVDEFQDTTELQVEILKLLHATARSRFFAVGDLSQSIYGFTGARPELVMPFGSHISARMDLSLSVNFRSSQLIVNHGERLLPRVPPMTAAGPNRDCQLEPVLITGSTAFEAVTEHFLPRIEASRIPLGESAILAKDWYSLIALARELREFGTPIVGPGARPYKRSRLFAQLAEQLCGAIVEPSPDTTRQLERALFHTVQDASGETHLDLFGFAGRRVLVRLQHEAIRLAEAGHGAVGWLDAMSQATADILLQAGYIDRLQSGLFYASVQEMKGDMIRQGVDLANLSIEHLGLFASPTRALRLSTIHAAKGREYAAICIIGMRTGSFPHYKTTDLLSEKRQFYVAITRAERFLMYVAERDRWNNPPSPFLGPSGIDFLQNS